MAVTRPAPPYPHLRRPHRRSSAPAWPGSERSRRCCGRRPERLTALDLAVLAAATFKASRTRRPRRGHELPAGAVRAGRGPRGRRGASRGRRRAPGDRRARHLQPLHRDVGRRRGLACTVRGAAHRAPDHVVPRRGGRERPPPGRLRRAVGKANELEQLTNRPLARRGGAAAGPGERDQLVERGRRCCSDTCAGCRPCCR